MKYLSLLIKPASSMCNLRCTYCFYEDVSKNREIASYGIMEENVMRKVIDRAFEACDSDGFVTFAFQGGEPTMAGLAYYRGFAAYAEEKCGKRKVSYSIQTNGTLIDDEWGAFFREKSFLVGVSLDGYEANMNHFRVDVNGDGVYSRVMNGIEILKKYKVEFNILTVVTQKLAKHVRGFYRFVRSQGFQYVQCIPCLGGLGRETEQEMRPREYAMFYKELYDLWLADLMKSDFLHISLFDNLLLMLKDQPPHQCGMLGFCSPQFVIEANGNIYPCDFYVLDEYQCGNVLEQSIEDSFYSEAMQRFLKEEKKSRAICLDCPFAGICHGGCKRQNGAYLRDTECAHREFLTYAYPTMVQIARYR